MMINTKGQGPKSSTQTQSLVLRVSAVARVFGRVHKQSDNLEPSDGGCNVSCFLWKSFLCGGHDAGEKLRMEIRLASGLIQTLGHEDRWLP